MTDKRLEENDRTNVHVSQQPQDDRDEGEDVIRRRESTRQAHLTTRERTERWPIG